MNVVAQIANHPKVVFERIQCLRIGEVFYGFELLLRGSEAHGVNLLAQKLNVGVIKEGLG